MSRARRWQVAARDAAADELAAALGVSGLLGRLLINRGVADPARAASFLGARLDEHLRSPMLFRDMAAASARLADALQRGEQIGIYGDYDVDGVSGSALLVRFLRAVGARPDPAVYIPHRLRDGYGLNAAALERLAAAGVRVLVTVDCGAVSHAEIALAQSRGMDVIVCDHHQVAATRPPAFAVLNPIEPDAGFPFSGLCGTGVAFYLALGVRMRLRERGGVVPDLRRELDLVALGTLADMVPLVEENRVLVKYGLRELQNSTRPGVSALRRVAGVARLSSGAVGFRLAPRLNAGGRLDDAMRSVELLTTDDLARAEHLAVALDDENRARQAIEREMLDEALTAVAASGGAGERRTIVLASPNFHPGVVGIVAARLVERYHRPTILIAAESGGIGRGSGRSIAGVDLFAALTSCRDALERFGGHRMAAGLSIRLERVPELASRFEAVIASQTSIEDFVPRLRADGELSLRDVNTGCVEDLGRLEPYGIGNPEPVFLARDVVVRQRRIVGEQHLKVVVEQHGRLLPAIGFGMSDEAIAIGDRLDILFGVMTNEWNDNVSVELRLRDVRPYQPA
ncbi:MAG: single-stranded-DNA-specific exonuclease RecJ [Candidatus Binatia bacterium]